MRTGWRYRGGMTTGTASPGSIPRESNKRMSEQDFGALIASACASERQNFRVALVDFLGLQFPANEAGANMTTANNAIALAQKDIVTAFSRRKAAAK